MNNLILGIWKTAADAEQTNLRTQQFLKAWDLSPDSQPLLDTMALTLWTDHTEGLVQGWRGDLFFLFTGRIYESMVSVPGEDSRDPLDLLAYLYTQYGEDFARHLNGAFSIVVYDRAQNQTRLIQSCNPDSRAYYWSSGQWGLCFSNRIRPLLSYAPEIATQSSPEGLYQLLFRSNIIAPKTFYDRISQVPFGSLLRVETETLVEYDPWRIPDQRIDDEAAALEEYERLIKEAMARFTSQTTDHVYLLSGGYDSSANVALAGDGPEKLITVGIGAKKFNTDAPYARMVADHVGTDHREYIFDGSEVEKLPSHICTLESPYFEPGMLLTCTALEIARANGRSVIGGEGTDQVFGSCAMPSYGRHRRSSPTRRLMRSLLRTAVHNPLTKGNVFLSKVENKLVGSDNINGWCGAMGFRDSDIRELVRGRSWREYNYDSQALDDRDLESMMRYCCTVLNRDYVYYGILPICGRLADTIGLETFTPYLDKRVLNFILSLDHNLRTPMQDAHKGTFDSKYLQKALALKLLPAEIFERPKQGGAINPFLHLEDTARLDAIKRCLTNSTYIQQTFRPEGVQALFNNPKQSAVRIFMLLTMDIWYNLVATRALEPVSEAPTLSEYLNV